MTVMELLRKAVGDYKGKPGYVLRGPWGKRRWHAVGDGMESVVSHEPPQRETQAALRGAGETQPPRLAPNGRPSRLNARQYAQVRTPEFKAWFGDWENDPESASKVVDDNGEPLVVYHGTPTAGFSAFSGEAERRSRNPPGVFAFTDDPANASTYAYEPVSRSFRPGGAVYPVFLRVTNPMMLDAQGRSWRNINGGNDNRGLLWDEKQQRWAGPDPRGKVPNRDIVYYSWKALESGYDGVIVRNVEDSANPDVYEKPQTTFLVFSPTQIKSAMSNSGAYSLANPDINKSMRVVRLPAWALAKALGREPVAGDRLTRDVLEKVQRWITVRPNGPGTDGHPVLIEEHPDGTGHIIAGAGGKLNFLKLTNLKSPEQLRAEARERAKEKRDRESGAAAATGGLKERRVHQRAQVGHKGRICDGDAVELQGAGLARAHLGPVVEQDGAEVAVELCLDGGAGLVRPFLHVAPQFRPVRPQLEPVQPGRGRRGHLAAALAREDRGVVIVHNHARVIADEPPIQVIEQRGQVALRDPLLRRLRMPAPHARLGDLHPLRRLRRVQRNFGRVEDDRVVQLHVPRLAFRSAVVRLISSLSNWACSPQSAENTASAKGFPHRSTCWDFSPSWWTNTFRIPSLRAVALSAFKS